MAKAKKDSDLVRSVREMMAHRRGEIALPVRVYTPPEKADVGALRKKLGYNQKQFAAVFGFTVSAVREWEQGRRKPERPARVLLALIAADPVFVKRTLGG